MSEIQIVGPTGEDSTQSIVNATRFKKFFDDDIVIEAGSKIHLNHAIFSKHESVVFTQDETFTFTISQANVYGALADPAPTFSGTIPEGVYTYSELKSALLDIIDTFLTDDALSSYIDIDAENPETKEQFFGIGPFGDVLNTDQDAFDNSHISIGCTFDAGNNAIQQNVADNANVVSFVMMPDPYFHGGVVTQDSAEFGNVPACIYDLSDDGNRLTIDAIISEPTAPKICMGFYGRDYSESNDIGAGSRTTAAAIVNVPQSPNYGPAANYPTMFFMSVLEQKLDANGAKGVFLTTYVAQDTATPQGTIRAWTSQQFEINQMKIIDSVRLDGRDDIDHTMPLIFELFTYQSLADPDFETQFKTYFGVKYVGSGKSIILTDTRTKAYYAKLAFFNGLGDDTALKKDSQLPFFPCWGCNIENYGVNIGYNNVDDTNDAVIVRQLEYSASSELSKAIGLKNNAKTIYPNPVSNIDLTLKTAIPSSFEDFYRMESYVVRLNNIPIEMFKSNDTKGNRGYKQNILAVVPTPFQEADKEARVNIDGQDYLSSTYSARYPQHKNMKNQRLVVNHFDVEISRLSDDTQATDLNQIAINFTITPPQ